MADTENNKNSNSPALRFPGFTEPWIRQSLSELVERVTRKNTGLQSALPLTISAIYGLVDQQSFFNKIVAGENLAGYYLIKNGEFAYNKSSSSDYPWGAIKRLNNHSEGVLSTLYICFSPKSGICSDYLAQYFESNKWHNGISEIAQEGARNHGLLNVGVKDFFATKHNIPSSISEQEQIAKFLQLLDERIATQRRLIEDLEKLKSSIVDRMFSDIDGEIVKFRDILEISTQRNDGKAEYRILSASQEFGMIERECLDIDIKAEAKSVKTYKRVHPGDYVLHLRSFQGGLAFAEIEGICSPAYTILRPNRRLEYGYLKEYFNSSKFIKSLVLVTYGIRDGRSINVEEFLDMAFTIHSKDKQGEIVRSLSALNGKVTVENSILNRYEQQRVYLLGKLFI